MLYAIRLCGVRLHKFKSFITSFPAFCPVKRQNLQRGRCHPPLLLKLPNAAISRKNYKCAKYPMEAVQILNISLFHISHGALKPDFTNVIPENYQL